MLENIREPGFHIYVVYPHKKLLSTKVRTLIDFMTGYFGDNSTDL